MTSQRRAFLAKLINVIGLGILGACRMPRIVVTGIQPAGPTALSPIIAPTLGVTGTTATTVTLNANYTAPPAAANFLFQQATNSGGPFSTIATQLSGVLIASPLTTGVTYYFRVAMIVTDGRQSDWSPIVSGQPIAVTSGAFPLLAAVCSGGNQVTVYTQAAAQRMARMHHVTFGCAFEGAGVNCYTGSAGGFIDYIHAQSAISTKVFRYYIPDTINATGGSLGVNPTIEAVLSAANMWLWQLGVSGTRTKSYYNTGYTMWNLSTYAPQSGGLYASELYAKRELDYYINGIAGGANQAVDKAPNADGLFHDGFAARTTVGGKTSVNATYQADWNRDGIADYQSIVGPPSGATIDQAYRDGAGKGPTYVHNNSSKLVIGNVAGWGNAGDSNGINFTGGSNVTGVGGTIDGGLLEALMGSSNGDEGRAGGGFNNLKTMVQFVGANTRQGVVWMYHGYDSNGVDAKLAANWQAPAYGACAAAVAGVHYCPVGLSSPYTSGTENYSPTGFNWADYFSVNLSTLTCTGESGSTSGTGWFNVPTNPVWTKLSIGSLGIYYRLGTDTGFGIPVMVCNPFENGAQSFQPTQLIAGKRFQRFNGTNRPAIDSGAIVATGSSIPMLDRDGIAGLLIT